MPRKAPALDTGLAAIPPQYINGEDEPISPDEHLKTVISTVRAQLGEDDAAPELQLWQFPIGGGKLAWCDSYPLERVASQAALLREVRAKWGPGKYKFLLHYDGKIAYNQVVSISPEPGELPAAGRRGSQMDELVAEMRQANQENRDALAAAIAALSARQAPAAPDPRGQFNDMLDTVSKLLAIARPSGGSDLAAQLASFSQMIEITGKMREMADGASNPPDLMTMLAPKVMDMVSAHVTQPKPSALPAPTPAVTVAPTAPPVPVQRNEGPQMNRKIDDLTEEQRAVMQALAQVNVMATFKTNPQTVAEMVYENADEQLFPLLHEADWFERLAQLLPAMREHEQWYRQVHEIVLKIEANPGEYGFELESGPGDDDGPEEGGASPPVNASPRAS